jgi:hypothetical protein
LPRSYLINKFNKRKNAKSKDKGQCEEEIPLHWNWKGQASSRLSQSHFNQEDQETKEKLGKGHHCGQIEYEASARFALPPLIYLLKERTKLCQDQ